MKRYPHVVVFLFVLISFCFAGFNTALASDDSTSTALQPQEIEGKIIAIDGEHGLVTIRDKERKRHVFSSASNTVFVGFKTLTELEKKQVVTVWYQSNDDGQLAMKIEKKLDAKCD
jgi:hypothetical protein